MARYHATVESRSPAAETFGYLATFSKCGGMEPRRAGRGAAGCRPARARQPLPPDGAVPGARMSLTYEVIRFVPDREVLLRAASALLRSTDRIVVTGAEHGSTVSYDAEVRLRGPLKLFDPLLRPGFRVVAERAAAGLARALSRRPPGRSTRTPAAAPAPSDGAAQPAEGKP